VLRAFLISLSESRWLRGIAERSSVGKRISGRFVAGTEVADALGVAQTLNRSGLGVSIDNLGENVTTPTEALHSAGLYRQLLSEISAGRLNANVSVKLTHMGLDVDPILAYDNVKGLSSGWTWKARPTPSARWILCMSCTGFLKIVESWAR
jgi:proline dehydrogenase